jgi:hypothetical protein
VPVERYLRTIQPRLIHPRAWKGDSANFRFTEFSKKFVLGSGAVVVD